MIFNKSMMLIAFCLSSFLLAEVLSEPCIENGWMTVFEFKLLSCDQIIKDGGPLLTVEYEVINDGAGALADTFSLATTNQQQRGKKLPGQKLQNVNHHLGEKLVIKYWVDPSWLDDEYDYRRAWTVSLAYQTKEKYTFDTLLQH